MAEILDHGQQLDLRTRRGADWGLRLQLWTDEAHTAGVDLSGAVAVTRIFAAGRADVIMSYVVTNNTSPGPSTIDLSLTAAKTLNMQQDWQYVIGYRDGDGATHPLLYGAFRVAQEQL